MKHIVHAAVLAAFAAFSPSADAQTNYIVPAQAQSGVAIPDVIVTDGSGVPVHLKRFAGFVIVLNFWSEHCGPCIKQMATLDRLQGNFRGSKLLVLPVSVDQGGVAAVKAFFNRYHYTYLRPYVDTYGAARALGVSGLPTSIVIDASGNIVGKAEGERVWDSDDMMQRLNWLLVKPATP